MSGYQNIPPSSSSGGAAGWAETIFVQKTGLSSSAYAVITQEFEESTNVAMSGTFTAAGTGAVQSGTALGTGIVTLLGPSSGAGSIKWWLGPTPQAEIRQLRTSRWMMAMRMAAGATPDSHSVMMAGANNAGVLNTFGIGYVAAASTWHYVRNSVQGVDLGTAIDGSGSVFVTCYVANFDLTNVVANMNPASGSDVICEAVTNLVNGASFPEVAVAPSGTVAQQDKLALDWFQLIAER